MSPLIDELDATYSFGKSELETLRALESAGDTGPVALVNYFKLRTQARYPEGTDEPVAGWEALMRYSETSGERLAAVGGHFLVQGAALGNLFGEGEDWDVVVVGNYPHARAVLELLQDDEYRNAYVHRRAAVERQRVTAVVGTPNG